MVKRKPLPVVEWTERIAHGSRVEQARLGNYLASVRHIDPLDDDAYVCRWLVHYLPPNNGPDAHSWARTPENAKRAAVKALARLMEKQP